MMRERPPAHYVRPNHGSVAPNRFFFLDSETRSARDRNGVVQTFRLAVVAYDRRERNADPWREREWLTARTPDETWAWIDKRTKSKARSVVVAHNVAFDLRITDAFRCLPALGWKLDFVTLGDRSAMVTWKRGERTLICVDTLSYVPVSLERLGQLVDLRKLPLPDEDDSDEQWQARCIRDVEILARVWRRLSDWVVRDDLGNWKPTGAGQCWTALRHRFLRSKLLVHDDDDCRTAERTASHTGRCEAWQTGELAHGPYVEWDFHAAYCTIGATESLPTELAGEVFTHRLGVVGRPGARGRFLAHVDVVTDVPCVPVRTGSGIVWPVGSFSTTLWDCEIQCARKMLATVTPTRAWVYRSLPALAEFCQWILDGMDERNPATDPVVRVALKHWSRAVIGRTAVQWTRPEPWGWAPVLDVALDQVHDLSSGESYRMLHLGHDLIRLGEPEESADASVAIMSWVMAKARVNLWNAMQTAGLENVAYMDTDSLIVNPAGHARLLSARVPGLRVKGSWDTLEVLGPRQVVKGGTLVAAGVPRDAVKVGEGRYTAEVWSGLTGSLRAREGDRVRVQNRGFRLAGTDRRRRHLGDGSTEPFELVGGEYAMGDGAGVR